AVAASLDLAIGHEKAREGRAEVSPNTPDRDVRAEILRREGGRLRTGDDDTAASAVFGDEGGVGVGAGLAGRAQAPARGRNRARVDRLNRRLEKITRFEKERTLLRVEEREPRVDRNLSDVGFDLRKIRVDRRVDRRVRVRGPL